jgi:hypothetical protein
MLLTYFLNDFEMVPVAPIITGITLVFTFHMHCISIVRSYYYYYYYYYYCCCCLRIKQVFVFSVTKYGVFWVKYRKRENFFAF